MSLPERIGKYRILARIGQGGMGIVYKALDPKINRILAVKVLAARLDAAQELTARFRQEARSAAQLSHKNIITIFDYDEEDGLAYIAMEYLEGSDLKTRISSREQLSLEEKLQIMSDFLEGLSHAHRSGVIHRDIKPANIFLTNSRQVKILDFGLARLADSDLTRSRFNMGTPAYMAPERLKGGKADHRSDIFAAGVVFYELLTYRKPFPGDSDFAISLKIVQGELEPFEAIDSNVAPDIAAIVYRMLEKEPEARYQSVDDLLKDLREARSSANEDREISRRNPPGDVREALTLVDATHTPVLHPPAAVHAVRSLPPPAIQPRSPGWFTTPRAIAVGVVACLLLAAGWLALQRPAALVEEAPATTEAKGKAGAPVPAGEARPRRPAIRDSDTKARAQTRPKQTLSQEHMRQEPQQKSAQTSEPATDSRLQEIRSGAETALHQVASARADAESAGAAELARSALDQALRTETEAREFYQSRQFSNASASAAKARDEFASAANEARQVRERLEIERQRAEAETNQPPVEAANAAPVSANPSAVVAEPLPKRAVPTLDRGAMVRRRRGEEIFSLDVEHLHPGGGKCRGELRLTSDYIQYVTDEPGQSARLSVSGTSLSVDRDRLTFRKAAGPEHVFRCRDKGQGTELKRVWDLIPQ